MKAIDDPSFRKRLAPIVVSILLVVSLSGAALLVGAAPGTDIGSLHTTDTDFNNADTLDNVTVTGSGDSASVELNLDDDYDVINDSGDGSVDSGKGLVGDTLSDTTYNSEFKIKPNYNGTVDTITLSGLSFVGSDYSFTVDIYAVQENPDQTVGEGTLVKSGWDPDFSSSSQSISLDSSFNVQKDQNWTLEFETSTSDNDATTDRIDIKTDGDSGLSGWSWNTITGSSDSGANINITGTLDEGSGTYVSANHSVDGAEQAFADISLQNANATVKWEYWDGSTWNTEDSTTYTSTGNQTASWTTPATSNGLWRVNVTFTVESGATVASLDDEGVQFTSSTPTVNNSSATPSGGTKTTKQQVTLSVDVNDSDFPTGQGDSVTVEFFVDGNSKGTDTLTSNGTATKDVTVVDGGSHDWHAVASDDYSSSADTTSQDFSFTVPDQLQVRNESDESQLITGDTIDATFYATDGVPIAELSTTDGNISLSNLPVGESFVAVVNVSDYHQRTIYIDSIYDQADIFMLNRSQPEAQTIFEITDNTGEYPLDTSVIKIQRALNRSEFANDPPQETRWVTITGETLGTDGSHTTHLERYARYRVVVENQDGDQAILGEFIAEFDSTRAFQIGQRDFDLTEGEGGVEYGASYTTSGGTKYVRFSLNDTEDGTSDVEVVIHERGNASNEIYNETHSGPYGDLSISQPLTAGQEDEEWVVEWSAENANVTDEIGSQFVVGQSQRALDIGSNNVETMVSVLLLLLTFFVSSAGINRYIGGVITPFMGATLWYIGWMPAEVGAGVVIFALFLGGAYYASSSKAGGF